MGLYRVDTTDNELSSNPADWNSEMLKMIRFGQTLANGRFGRPQLVRFQ